MTSSDPFTPSRHLHLDTIDSTNAEGLRLAGAGECGPLWITAGAQTAGRGRSGRPWTLPAGNLAATLLITPDCRLADLQQLAFVAAVAVHEAIMRATDGAATGLRLKWPNDLLIGGAKVGGILVEATAFGREAVAVIGIGLNVVTAPALPGREVAHLASVAPSITGDVLLRALDGALQRWLAVWLGGVGFAHVRSAWMARGGAPGEAISVNMGTTKIDGTFLGLDDGGALLLREASGTLRRLTYGDVSLMSASGNADERTTL